MGARMTRGELRRLHAWVPRELYEMVAEKAIRRYGRVQGSISRFVVEALRRYIEEEQVKEAEAVVR